MPASKPAHLRREAMKTRKTKNPVAKHARSFNKASIHKDRKKALKRGYIRCKSDFRNTQGDSKAA